MSTRMERRIRWHSQNLTDGKKPLWREGRAWLHLREAVVRSEWWFFNSRRRKFAMTTTVGGDEDQVQLHLELPTVFSIWFTLENFLPRRWFRDWKYWGVYGRETGIKLFDGAVWLYLWHNDAEVHQIRLGRKIPGLHLWGDEHGLYVSFDPADFVFGSTKYHRAELFTQEAQLALPEGTYPIKVMICQDAWKRPRWPVTRRLMRASIDCGEKGIPAHAGKGENSYDLDDDFVYSMTCQAGSVGDAVRALTNSILSDRKRYGNPADPLPDAAAGAGDGLGGAGG